MPLDAIGQLLRHASLDATLTYTKVDASMLGVRLAGADQARKPSAVRRTANAIVEWTSSHPEIIQGRGSLASGTSPSLAVTGRA